MPFPILENKIKVLPHSCFVCSKAFVRKNTLFKHYKAHSKELGPNLEHLEDVKAKYLQNKHKENGSDLRETLQNSPQSIITSNTESKLLPYVCFICSKSFVRQATLLKHYHEQHSESLGPDLEYLDEVRLKYKENKFLKTENIVQNYGFQDECQPEAIIPEQQDNNQNVIQNLDSNDIIITNLDSSNIMVQNLDPSNIVQHIDTSTVPSLIQDSDFSMTIIPEKTTNECSDCGTSFSSSDALTRHSLIHEKVQIFPCDACKESFATVNELDAHYSIHNSFEAQFICGNCNHCFISEGDFEKHMFVEGHFKSAKMQCSACKIGFTDQKCYEEHSSIHKIKKRTCEICKEVFKKQTDLKKHWLEHVGEEPHLCEHCQTGFFQINALKLHYLRQHPHERKFVCYICIESFTLESDLEKHNVKHSKSGKYVCYICIESFSSELALKKHNSRHKKFECDVCKKRFLTKAALNKHSMIHKISKDKLNDDKTEHPKKKIYVCSICKHALKGKKNYDEHKELHKIKDSNQKLPEKKRKIKVEGENGQIKKQCKKNTVLCEICEDNINSEDFEDHMLMHNKGRMHTCRVCSSSFTFKEDLEEHSKTVHESGKPFSCNICDERFSFKSDLREHKQIHIKKKTFLCNKHCQKSFTEKVKFLQHIKTCNNIVKHSCRTCGEMFKFKVKLQAHEKTHGLLALRDSGHKEFLCKYCGGKFDSKSKRSAHMVNCDKKKFHLCKNCNQRFKTRGELLIHKKVHSRRHPFICKICNEGFELKEALEDHKNIHKINPTYPCNICDEDFTQKENLRVHKDEMHKDEIVYICRECDTTFENKMEFKAHRETHDFITHQCKVCSETFGSRKELKRHYLKHILERPNLCRICNATFEQWGALRSHYLSHTRN